MPDSTAECTAAHFLSGWVSNFGAPVTIITDQGCSSSLTPGVDALPIILLTWRATEKEDLHHTPADLVYWEDLRLPGQFAAPGPPAGHALAFLPVLRQAMANLRPTPPRPPPSRPTHFPADLRDAAAVFLRTGATTGPLQPPYVGPYLVLHMGEKYVTLEI
ncbi:uncharacterized protein LOC123511047 [Portunus trituberculatus]|uniref:uncharacterized protein LOC123511047 n=1 Tax=Portunus trituberculatus TaxID=210409 RepID=UPI001E1CE575|nr:uncharacterized protein LOC123511047 [Portunus trituberculatus]